MTLMFCPKRAKHQIRPVLRIMLSKKGRASYLAVRESLDRIRDNPDSAAAKAFEKFL